MTQGFISSIIDKFMSNMDFWVLWGLVFQLAFMGRFIVQWIASEAKGKSVIPVSFWYLSLVGSTGLLIYAVVRADPIFILGQSLGTVIYTRNLVLIAREKAAPSQEVRGFPVIDSDQQGNETAANELPAESKV